MNPKPGIRRVSPTLAEWHRIPPSATDHLGHDWKHPRVVITYLEAAITVLKEAGGPLHYRQITERALAAQLIEPRGLGYVSRTLLRALKPPLDNGLQ